MKENSVFKAMLTVIIVIFILKLVGSAVAYSLYEKKAEENQQQYNQWVEEMNREQEEWSREMEERQRKAKQEQQNFINEWNQ